MRRAEISEKKKCPKCGRSDSQMKNGSNRSGTQRIMCRHCKKTYTLEPKRNAYDEETRALALKIYYAGASGRGVGKVLGMSKANVYNWIKKNESEPES
jgi:transposase-like protein